MEKIHSYINEVSNCSNLPFPFSKEAIEDTVLLLDKDKKDVLLDVQVFEFSVI